ncbi:MAG: glycine-rich protein, partial [Oscillibacter sp.]|nr:glycine-rich protein [Oscillibacter sp.]
NTNNGVNRLSSLSDLNFRGDEREQALNYLKNVNSGTTNSINGPVRCGLFATSATNQTQAGATYWGVMEMSGNLKELCVSVGNPNFNGGSSGTGVYNANLWDKTATKYGVRGGGFSSPDSLLRTSDRTEAMNYFTTITQRDSTVGFRGVYSLSGIKIDGGEIKMSQDTACWGETDVLNVVAASCPDFPDVRFQYNWYVKKPGEAKFDIIANAAGESLTYEHFENKTTAPVVYTFKRTGICAMGVAESNQVTVKVLPEPFVASSYTFDPCPVAIPHRWGGLNYTWKMSGVPGVSFVDDNKQVYVNGIATNGNYTLEVQWEQCPDIFSVSIETKNIFAPTGATTFVYTGAMQCVVLPAGKYKVEAWGAQGGSYGGTGGYGGYTTGEINLTTQNVLYIYVGQQGYANTSNYTFNGGGKPSAYYNARGGGGASDVRLAGADWNNFNSLKSRLMVAGGGGGTDYFSNTALNGGAAGGLTGSDGGRHGTICKGYSDLIPPKGGTQTAGGTGGYSSYGGYGGVGGFGYGGSQTNSHGGGGGSGYYGGGNGGYTCGRVGSGAGGSSFISGHSGCDAISASSTMTNIIHTGQPIHYSGFYFSNTSMTAGARAGHGQVRITPIN